MKQATTILTVPTTGEGFADVTREVADFLRRAASPPRGGFRHAAEGPDDMPAHIRAALTPTQISIPVMAGRLALGTWQAIYLVEHRTRAHTREIALHLIGA